MKVPPTPKGYNTVNPFIITTDARKLISFIKEVFAAEERSEAFTTDTDGLVLHAELTLGNSVILCVDSKKDWPVTPAFLQVYVEDVEQTLKKAQALGGKIITKPTDFYGDMFSRMLDPYGNLWWIYQHTTEMAWDDSASSDDTSWDASSEGLNYIHQTIMDIMPTLGKK